jgi:hypothetical protein
VTERADGTEEVEEAEGPDERKTEGGKAEIRVEVGGSVSALSS